MTFWMGLFVVYVVFMLCATGAIHWWPWMLGAYGVWLLLMAFHLEPRRSPRATALLAHAYRLAGNTTRADGYVQSAEQSSGTEFAQAVREELARLQEEQLG